MSVPRLFLTITARCGWSSPLRDRGRDAGYPAPPARIRTGGFPASGSYRGCLTANRTAGNGCRIVTDGIQPTQRRVNCSHVRGRR